ncbi:phosphatidate phosphatase PAH1 [Brachypodium distachyon]|uniref:phosphatidate phosphatase n=1 Tax=Brachypodium distachyon TaxID=15368 RepID=I1HIN3_BRADI|nr:phosphatidate phosphatase PAH1 [Brachypodium distachyon]XP_010231287.1 phosphatidate phosphatase PAH1 [Brachypodium distachyon]XP_010231288.1 phosphatidate phosphatase PAH1 [Brachypodium distachyon]XP_010231289.1 phosphatidate phosphatase PAH1 [Brachypodium distachyon]KQK05865.1 hypothetical protein BRADI_2g23040v3 [Brachypodium distachyon]KQK05866.1 hypothetical protein BRADI_2g23040v3 [Brachypodium distachyon]KQK05867.1 hypothetical protein BRADI_2g23040v3 [Brachypodium distachyon]KQK05|eukprot:XP_010231286.1 phosphatidate phosphatase PAH1 [Brachypodium distachyon]
MDVVGMVGRGVGRVLSQGMYSVATPFHPFGGAVDIIVVEQPDGSYRSTPWYVRFGKFQGVLKGAEKVVTITVNGVEASFHMLLDNSGQAHFMRELEPGSEDSRTGPGEVINEPETPLRSKSDGELYIGTNDQLVCPELNENQEEETGEEFDSYGYSKLEEAEDLTKQADGGTSDMLLVSVNGCVLTAPISSTEESMEDVQLSEPQFHLGPGQSSSGDFSRSGEVWETGILDDIYISQEKLKFDSEHPSEVSKELQEVLIEKDKSHDIRVNEYEVQLQEVSIEKDESHVLRVSEYEALHVSVNEGEAFVASTNEVEVQDISQSGNNGSNNQFLTLEDEAHDISGNNIENHRPLPNKDVALDVSESKSQGYQTLTNEDEARQLLTLEDEAHDISGNNIEDYKSLPNKDVTLDVSENNNEGYQSLTNEDEALDVSEDNNEGCQSLTNEDEALDVSENNNEGCQSLTNEDEALDVPENKIEGYEPLTNEDAACDIPLVQVEEACKSPAKIHKVGDASNENIEARLGRYDTFRSCLDLTSQDDGDSGTEPFSPEFDHQRDSQLSLSNRSDVDIDLGEDGSESAHCDHLDEVDVSSITSDNNITQSEDSSPHYGKASDLSYEGGSYDRSKDTIPSKIRLHSSPRSSDKDKLGSIPENPSAEEELNKEHPRVQKGLGFEISLCGHMLRPGMGRTSADDVFQQHLVHEEDFKSSGPSIIKNANLIVKIGCNYFVWSKVSHIILGKAVFGPDFSVEPIDAIPVELQETPGSREDSLGMSPSSRRWRLWPIPFRISRSLQRSNSDSSEDIFLDTETVLSPMDEQAPENKKNQSPRKQFVRTLIPTSEQVASLNLKEGQNIVTFSFCTRVFGKQQVDAHIYVWKWNAKIVISDVDGTITRSDVLGQVMPLVGRDWSQSGVARLFCAIKENGYQLIFLSARAIVQAYLTKNFLFNLKQDGKALPNGPVVISPDGLFPSLYREVIRRAPHEFKIACLEDIKALFPSDYNPFYAGFGNRDTDELSYKKMGIPKGKIFIINPKGEVAINSSVDVKSYTSLHTLVNDMFPPTTLVEQEDYNSWNYWKVPLPDVDL